MDKNFLSKLNELPVVIDRAKLIEMLEPTIDSINTEVMSMLDNIMENSTDYEIVDKDKIKSSIKITGARDGYGVIKIIKTTLEKIYSLKYELLELVEDGIGKTVSRDEATYKEASIILYVKEIMSTIVYTPDYLLYILKESDDLMSKKKLRDVKLSYPSYLALISKEFSSVENDIKNLNALNDTVVINEDNFSATSNLIMEEGKDFIRGIITKSIIEPIARFRLMIIDIQIKRLENLLNKKNLFENRVLELKRKKEGAADDETAKKLEAAIEVYISKIEKLEYEIKRLEK